MSLRAVADALKAGALNARGARWQPQTVANVLARTWRSGADPARAERNESHSRRRKPTACWSRFQETA